MKKRVLWLLNHTTLRGFEVPMLVEMGYEVFTPKLYQYEYGDLSASVTYEYDKTLSIPEEALSVLNDVDFYQEFVSDKVVEIMNSYFDMAVFGAFVPQVKMLVRVFRGVLVFQAFGLDKTMTYSKLFSYERGNMLEEIQNCGERFWFGASYENLAEVECEFFQRQYLYLPIGLKKDQVNRVWVGGDERILFVGPKIATNAYYRNVYKQFKKEFGDIPHVVGGAQMVPVTDDPTVLGFVPKEQFDYNMSHLAAMYYHSREPRHLHYHPLEAVANGMPLVFMADGLLDELGGKNLPGRCTTIKQAHEMLLRLSNGDRGLAERIIASQGVLLDQFKKEFCRGKWKEAFENVLRKREYKYETREKEQIKIAIVVPAEYTGGVLDFSVRLARAVQAGAADEGDDVHVILYYPENPVYLEKDYFKSLRESDIPVQSYRWAYKPSAWFDNFWSIKGIRPFTAPSEGYVIEDGISNLNDCSYVIFTSDRIPAPYFVTPRSAVVVHDVIQRYVPALFDEAYEISRQHANRNADAILVTTPYMQETAVQYIGIPQERVRLIPQMYDVVQVEEYDDQIQKPYFHWSTNISVHKNHEKAISGLREYYANGGKLKCYITGANTEYFNPKNKESDEYNAYVKLIRSKVQKSQHLRKNLVFCGELERNEYLRLLKGASFSFHPGYADNGNGACVEAVQLGVPVLSTDYPVMRYMSQRMGMNAVFFDSNDPSAIAKQLKYMEENHTQIASALPGKDCFDQFTWQGQRVDIYQTIRSIIRGH